MRKSVSAVVLALIMSVVGAAPALAQGGPIGPDFWTPGYPDLCDWSSIEAWAETQSNGVADNGFDRVGGPDARGTPPPGENDCND